MVSRSGVAALAPSAHEIRAQLARILASDLFQANPRVSSFLSYVVGEVLDGRAGEIKQTTIGADVFGRPASYDPRQDSVVRSTARFLRDKLHEYYLADGVHDPVRIDLPKGSYVPTFEQIDSAAMPPVAGASSEHSRRPAAAVAITAFLSIAALACAAYWIWRPARPGVNVLTIATFEDPSGAADANYLSQGVRLALSSRLGSVPGLRVVEDAARIDHPARLTGTLRRVGDKLYITAHLMMPNASTRWSESFEGPPARLLPIQYRIVNAVARALGKSPPEIPPGELAPASGEAYDLYLQGRYLWANRQKDSLAGELDLFQRAVAVSPHAPWGYLGKADALAVMISNNALPIARLGEAREAALAAISRDPVSPEAHAALGLIEYDLWDYSAAERDLRRAIQLNPSYPNAHHRLGLVEANLGRFPEAEAEFKAADALNPAIRVHASAVAALYYHWHRYDEAIALSRQILNADPNQSGEHANIGSCRMMQGRYREAYEEFRRANESLLNMATALAAQGDRTGAQALIRKWQNTDGKAAYLTPGDWAGVYVWIDHTHTLDLLEQAYTAHDPQFPSARWEPAFDVLHGQPRFRKLFENLHLGGAATAPF